MALTVQPYVFFDGNCAEAVAFYKEALGADVHVMTFGDSPMDVPPDHANKVMHATIKFGEATLFASDGMPNVPIDEGMRAHISIGASSEAEGRKCFDALAKGGTVTMPYAKQFWGDTFGMVTDRFGVKWMVDAAG